MKLEDLYENEAMRQYQSAKAAYDRRERTVPSDNETARLADLKRKAYPDGEPRRERPRHVHGNYPIPNVKIPEDMMPQVQQFIDSHPEVEFSTRDLGKGRFMILSTDIDAIKKLHHSLM